MPTAIVGLLSLLLLAAGGGALEREWNATAIIPLLWNGPNNQIAAIREAMALVRVLGPGFVTAMPDLITHKYTDGDLNKEEPMLFTELFDVDSLRKGGVPHVLLRDLPHTKRGWRNLDALLYMRDDTCPSIVKRVKSSFLSPPPADKIFHSPISITRGCASEDIVRLRAMLQPYSFVALLTFNDIAFPVANMAGTLLLDCGADACCQASKDTAGLLRKSHRLHALADAFIRDHIGPDARFIATHVRPYGDKCVDVWRPTKPEVIPQGVLRRNCINPYLYHQLVPSLQAMRAAANTSAVFMLSPPGGKARAIRMLKDAGMEPIVMDMAHIRYATAPVVQSIAEAQRGNRRLRLQAARAPRRRRRALMAAAAADDDNANDGSGGGGGGGGEEEDGGVLRRSIQRMSTPLSFSLLAMVEEAVAARAAVFVGTAESSLTGAIMLERTAHGMAPSTSYFYSEVDKCAGQEPCPLPYFYTSSMLEEARNHALKRHNRHDLVEEGEGEGGRTERGESGGGAGGDAGEETAEDGGRRALRL